MEAKDAIKKMGVKEEFIEILRKKNILASEDKERGRTAQAPVKKRDFFYREMRDSDSAHTR